MPNCEDNPGVAEVLDSVLVLLDETEIAQRIDGPIDESLVAFISGLHLPEVFTEARFRELVADFVAHLHAEAMPSSHEMTRQQAQSQALHLLDACYKGMQADGYDGALIDALRLGEDGLTSVFVSLANHLKTEERQKYFRWVMATHIEPLSWQKKCQLVEAMLRRWGWCFPEEVRGMPVEQLAYLYADLIRESLSAIGGLDQICATRPEAPGRDSDSHPD